MSDPELLYEGRRLEELGRKIAYERDKIIDTEDLEFLRGVELIAYKIGEKLYELQRDRDWFRMGEHISQAATSLLPVVGALMLEKRRGEVIVPTHVQDSIREVDRFYNMASGETRCSWLLNLVTPYRYPSAVNDITACFHRMLEEYSVKVGNWVREGKCIWRV